MPTPPLKPSLPTAAILVAAGESHRMGRIEGERKPLAPLGGLTVLEHAAAAFGAVDAIEEIVVVAHRDDLAAVCMLTAESPALAKVSRVVEGGQTRTDSVRAGVEAASDATEWVAIHDAARPLVLPRTIELAIEVAGEQGAALVAIPVNDTIKASDDGRYTARTLNRSKLWSAQTPQVFRRKEFLELLERACVEEFSPSDDAALYERFVGPVSLVCGETSNFKLTTPIDLVVAAAILLHREASP